MDTHDLRTPPPEAAVAAQSAVDALPTRSQPGAPAAVPRPRRRRRWIIALAGLLVLLGVPVGGYFYLAWQQDRELAAILAETERADPRWRWEQLMADRPPVADEDNPTLVVLKVDALVRGVGGGGYDVGQKNWRLFENDTPPEHRPNGLQIVALRESFAKHGEALKLARSLKDYPGEGRHSIKVAPDWISTNLEPLQRTRGVLSMLQNDAMLRAEDEDAAGAMQSCRACLVAARSIGHEPYLIAVLIRFAGQAMAVNAMERTLAQTEPPEAELAAMQKLLASEIAAPTLVEGMRGERAGTDALIGSLKHGQVKLSALMVGPRSGAKTWEAWMVDFLPLVVTGGRPELLRLMNKNVEAAKLPPEKQAPVFADIEKEGQNSSATFVRLLLPACGKVAGAHRRTQAQMRCAMVGLAAERYRIKHGQWPAALADLTKDGLLRDLPNDPCDGGPLRYKALPNGMLIYSVGMDRVDNGGALDRVNLMGPGVDIGFVLWDVSARRQAPLPPPPPPE